MPLTSKEKQRVFDALPPMLETFERDVRIEEVKKCICALAQFDWGPFDPLATLNRRLKELEDGDEA